MTGAETAGRPPTETALITPPRSPSMRDPLARRATATPDRIARIDPDGTELSYTELEDRVATLAGQLARRGVTADDHLGILLDGRPVYVSLVHAAIRLGCRLVPLNPTLDVRALARQVDRADVGPVVCGADTVDVAAELGRDRLLVVDAVDATDAAEPLSTAEPTPVDPPSWRFDDPALLLFTSGTTGNPKAVTLTVGNLVASAAASATRLGVLPADRWLSPLPPYHMGGLAPIYRSVLYGTAVIVPETTGPTTLADLAHRHDVTGLSLVPTLLDRLLGTADGLPASLRFVLLGGGRIPPGLVDRALSRSVPVHPTYGLTETASQVATATPSEARDESDTVGRPLVVTTVTIVDEAGDPVAPGTTGEIVVDGPTVTPGYFGDPTATEAAFGPHGFHTGDRGSLDASGRLTVVGRRDDRIVTGGENVDPRAVADVIRSLAGVAEVAVVGLADPEWGERVAALVVPESGTALSVDQVDRHCTDRLAGHERPKTVVIADSLPRTPSGTVDRDRVRERLQTGE